MPGRRLNDDEREFQRFWAEPPAKFRLPLLKSIMVEGPPALRGIDRLRIPFEYPITGICGRNGVGKSTVLALATLSAFRPSDWSVRRWTTAPARRQPKRTTYNWADFFFRQKGEGAADGLSIRFTFTIEGNDVEIERRHVGGRWCTMPDPGRSKRPRFPRRAIEFVSVARIVPLAELQYVRQRFAERGRAAVRLLDGKMVEVMRHVFRRRYTEVEIHESGAASLAVCKGEGSYTGFDMGAGENAMIAILERLERLPIGGLLVVEEIEHGLHPEALRYLIGALTGILCKRRQQMIFTTHSDHVIDSLPRAGRLLLDRVGGEHRTVTGPTTRFAMANMTGEPKPEAKVYVEDGFAAALVAECLGADLRRRVSVVPIGNGRQVAAELGAHRRGGMPGPAVCVFDGDCKESEIEGWFRSEDVKDPTYENLPGRGLAPEKWVVKELMEDPYLSEFAARLRRDSREAREEIERLDSVQEHHDVVRELATRLTVSEEIALDHLVGPLGGVHPSLMPIREMVVEVLSEK